MDIVWIILGISLMITLVLLQRAYLAAWNRERGMYLEFQMELERSRRESRAMRLLANQAGLRLLAEEWESRARSKFESAQAQSDEAARTFIEHGATCYFNCAQQLRTALASASPLTSATPSEAQT